MELYVSCGSVLCGVKVEGATGRNCDQSNRRQISRTNMHSGEFTLHRVLHVGTNTKLLSCSARKQENTGIILTLQTSVNNDVSPYTWSRDVILVALDQGEYCYDHNRTFRFVRIISIVCISLS